MDPQNESVYPGKILSNLHSMVVYLASAKWLMLPCRQAIHDMMNECLIVGVTSMHRNAGWIIKVLAGDPYGFRKQ